MPNMLKEIPGFLGYFASDDGEIYSAWNKNSRKPEPNAPLHKMSRVLVGTGSGSYFAVHLRKAHKQKVLMKVGQLVLMAFVGPRPTGFQMCHGPNGRFDDSLKNLSWGSPKKNLGDDKRRDRTMQWGERHGNSKLTDEIVRQIRAEYGTRGKGGLTQVQLAKKFSLYQGTVSAIIRRAAWKHI